MSLNIKNPETNRLIRELAGATGESMTQAVTTAVRERLARVRHDFDVNEVLELAREIRESLPPGYLDRDFDQELYDDDGLPR